MTQVTITISENPFNVSYSESNVVMNSAGDITYTINSQNTGWTIIGLGNANTNGNNNLSYQSQALPMQSSSSGGGGTGVFMPVSGAQSVVLHGSYVDVEETGGPCVCQFSFLLTDGNVTLIHDPQVTNDPG